ncbi:hypothetical protein [Mycobacterium sp. NPDC050441]|uniref:hypothetical protein n=1 Tax=Mycobacterium sp. NPDC050441 TaxID=3155403 RepID=UPI0034018BDF
MKRRTLLKGAGMGMVGVSTLAATGCGSGSEPLRVRSLSGFHVGGGALAVHGEATRPTFAASGLSAPAADPNGDFEIGQLYAHEVRLDDPRSRHPVVFWPGGGLSGVCYEGTPDGRPGWQQLFLRNGYDTVVCDPVGCGRAPSARYPEVYPSEPLFRTKAEIWDIFRIGPGGGYATDPGERRPYPGARFPVAAFDHAMQQVIPRYKLPDDLRLPAYDALFERIGSSILLSHSASGPDAFTTVVANPDRVVAHIAVEPSGSPVPADTDLRTIKHIPHLVIWGDRIDDEPAAGWRDLWNSTREFTDRLQAAGGDVTWIDLPARGITGNTHMSMWDDNSDQIAGLILQWLKDAV